MGDWIALASAMAVLAVVADAPGVLLVAVLTLGYGSLRTVWTRYGMRRVEYSRRLGTGRAVAGDSVPLDITIWNRKRLPLPWVTAEDRLGERLTVRERPEMHVDEYQQGTHLLRNDWALQWYERVVRHFHLDDVRRGSYRFGPVQLSVRDFLGRLASEERIELSDTLVVTPAMAAVRHAEHEMSPLGERRARHSLTVDPALFAGVRPFQAGDSLRLVHWRATARLGSAVSRRLEPARGRTMMVVVDVQTVDGPVLTWDEDAFESLTVVAASLARRLLADGASLGMAAANFAGSAQKFAWLAPRASMAQLPRAGELLARIGPVPSAPLSALLAWLTKRMPAETALILVTARAPGPHVAALRRMKLMGFGVELVTVGPDAAVNAQTARMARMRAMTATVEPSWEEPDAVVLAG
ncbi:MAG TPA: DUF58 domain-containing protein [Candidatus Limnocylindria bacterium]